MGRVLGRMEIGAGRRQVLLFLRRMNFRQSFKVSMPDPLKPQLPIDRRLDQKAIVKHDLVAQDPEAFRRRR